MDQMTSACGEAGYLLALLCQPAELQGTILLPDDLAVWGLDSGVRHSVGAGDYGLVRIRRIYGLSHSRGVGGPGSRGARQMYKQSVLMIHAGEGFCPM
ncbi:MAG: hypothetical protein WKF84_23105 [Pyrinomonadaceae bacterium]